mgnify:CR=1 FL=1
MSGRDPEGAARPGRLEVPKELLERYATSAPRYTSYPTAVDWEKDPGKAFDPADYPARLAAAADARRGQAGGVRLPVLRRAVADEPHPARRDGAQGVRAEIGRAHV